MANKYFSGRTRRFFDGLKLLLIGKREGPREIVGEYNGKFEIVGIYNDRKIKINDAPFYIECKNKNLISIISSLKKGKKIKGTFYTETMPLPEYVAYVAINTGFDIPMEHNEITNIKIV